MDDGIIEAILGALSSQKGDDEEGNAEKMKSNACYLNDGSH